MNDWARSICEIICLGLRWRGWGGRLLPRLIADRKGASAILFALSLPILIGFLGLSVETAYWYLEKRELQEAADSAALAGAREYGTNNANQAMMETAAATAADKSGFPNVVPVVNQPPASGRFAIGGIYEDPNAVEAILTETYGTYFVSLFGVDSVDITTRAVAVEGGGFRTTACILALAVTEPEICGNNDTGIVFQGSLDLTLSECSVHSNDSCGPSYDFNGNPTLDIDCLTYSGGLDPGVDPISGTSSNLAMNGCTEALYVSPLGDPYAKVSVPTPTILGNCVTDPAGVPDPDDLTNENIRIFSPGYYCDNDPSPSIGGMELLTGSDQFNMLDPGIYFIEDSIRINGATIIGYDVTLVLIDDDGTFDFNGNGDLILTAPNASDIYNNGFAPGFDLIQSQGDSSVPQNYWGGLAIYITGTQDLGDNNPCANKINGTSILQVSGAIYAPDTCISFTGNNTAGGADDPCFRLIAGNITLAGNVTMSSENCDMAGGGDGGPTYGTMVGLVE